MLSSHAAAREPPIRCTHGCLSGLVLVPPLLGMAKRCWQTPAVRKTPSNCRVISSPPQPLTTQHHQLLPISPALLAVNRNHIILSKWPLGQDPVYLTSRRSIARRIHRFDLQGFEHANHAVQTCTIITSSQLRFLLHVASTSLYQHLSPWQGQSTPGQNQRLASIGDMLHRQTA
ncbi:hypothetical protein F5Y08DRAFT_97534 [Xylaria arbuscula]|nr:hypothetical protein F5Y08DRAFT_97534 [Xylaria arbuscula]